MLLGGLSITVSDEFNYRALAFAISFLLMLIGAIWSLSDCRANWLVIAGAGLMFSVSVLLAFAEANSVVIYMAAGALLVVLSSFWLVGSRSVEALPTQQTGVK